MFLCIVFILIFLIHAVSGFSIISDDYSVESYHTGIAGGKAINSEDSRFTLTAQQGSSRDAENEDYLSNIGWFSTPSYCGDGTCDDDETCSTCVSDCGTCAAGGGGGGGGCSYDWVCSDWYPAPCPESEIQDRLCVNRGTCSGTVGMPDHIRNCTYVPVEPLFDAFAKIPLRYKWVNPGEVIGIDIEVINLGKVTTMDVFFKYWIVDENDRLISEMQETRAIAERDKFRVAMVLPPETEIGNYKFYVQIDYLEKFAIAEDSFKIIQSKIGRFMWIILLGLIISLVMGILIILIFKLKKFKRI